MAVVRTPDVLFDKLPGAQVGKKHFKWRSLKKLSTSFPSPGRLCWKSQSMKIVLLMEVNSANRARSRLSHRRGEEETYRELHALFPFYGGVACSVYGMLLVDSVIMRPTSICHCQLRFYILNQHIDRGLFMHTARRCFCNIKSAMLEKRIRRRDATVVPGKAGTFAKSQPAFNFLMHLLEYRVCEQVVQAVLYFIVHHKVLVLLAGRRDRCWTEDTEFAARINIQDAQRRIRRIVWVSSAHRQCAQIGPCFSQLDCSMVLIVEQQQPFISCRSVTLCSLHRVSASGRRPLEESTHAPPAGRLRSTCQACRQVMTCDREQRTMEKGALCLPYSAEPCPSMQRLTSSSGEPLPRRICQQECAPCNVRKSIGIVQQGRSRASDFPAQFRISLPLVLVLQHAHRDGPSPFIVCE